MSQRSHAGIFWTSILLLLVLHSWPAEYGRVEPMLLGWIPYDMAYYLAWIGLAAIAVLHLTAKVWRTEE